MYYAIPSSKCYFDILFLDIYKNISYLMKRERISAGQQKWCVIFFPMLQEMSRVDGIIWRCIHLHKIVRLLLKSISQNLCDICWVKSMDHEDKILWWHSKEIEFFFSLTFSCTIKQHIQQYLKTLLSVFCIFRWEFFGKTTFKLKLTLRFYCKAINV